MASRLLPREACSLCLTQYTQARAKRSIVQQDTHGIRQATLVFCVN
jgi:hypothetical protein